MPVSHEVRSGVPSPRDPLERYAAELFDREDPLLAELRAEMERRGLPLIQVPVRTGLLLRILVVATGAKRILEIGTLGGYSALWMAAALPAGGRILSLEKESGHAQLAREFLEVAGLDDKVEVREGVAADLLPALGPEGSFDLVFLDADKESYTLYLEHAARLLRAGGLLLADNAFWQGRVLEEPADPASAGVQAFNHALAASEAFLATILPIGDGVAMGVRRGSETLAL
jgi:predicted O-methyltransferase YrrM